MGLRNIEGQANTGVTGVTWNAGGGRIMAGKGGPARLMDETFLAGLCRGLHTQLRLSSAQEGHLRSLRLGALGRSSCSGSV